MQSSLAIPAKLARQSVALEQRNDPSEREMTEAMVTLCSSCKPESVRAITGNWRILTGSSQNHRQKRLNLRLWNLVSPPKKESVSSGAGSQRPQHAAKPLRLWAIGGRSFPFADLEALGSSRWLSTGHTPN